MCLTIFSTFHACMKAGNPREANPLSSKPLLQNTIKIVTLYRTLSALRVNTTASLRNTWKLKTR